MGSSELFVLRPDKKLINREYVYGIIRSNEFITEASKRLTRTSGLRRVPRNFVENFKIPIPPLELQQEFAERVEGIEAMKRELEAQIADAQTLLDSRMDHWFN